MSISHNNNNRYIHNASSSFRFYFPTIRFYYLFSINISRTRIMYFMFHTRHVSFSNFISTHLLLLLLLCISKCMLCFFVLFCCCLVWGKLMGKTNFTLLTPLYTKGFFVVFFFFVFYKQHSENSD